MQTTRKNVKAALVAALVLALAGCLLYLAGVKILLFAIGNKSLVSMVIVALLLAAAGGLLAKIRIGIRAKVLAVILLPVLVYASACLFDALLPVRYDRCDVYTKKLNGGLKSINGRVYNVSMCGTGGDSMQSGDEVRLQVFGASGRLLVQRHFTVNWNENYPNALEYGTDRITYYDNNGKGGSATISFPPTVVEWMRARLPFFN